MHTFVVMGILSKAQLQIECALVDSLDHKSHHDLLLIAMTLFGDGNYHTSKIRINEPLVLQRKLERYEDEQ